MLAVLLAWQGGGGSGYYGGGGAHSRGSLGAHGVRTAPWSGREVGEAVEPHLQVLARLASEEELLAADGRVDWFERLVYSRGRRTALLLGRGCYKVTFVYH